MQSGDVSDAAKGLAEQAEALAKSADQVAAQVSQLAVQSGGDPFWYLLTIFILACFVGFYVVWSVTPALHSPLMGVTNAVSSVIIVGALLATSPDGDSGSRILGFIAVVLASVNIFGGFVVTQRMLAMFKKKEKVKVEGGS